MITRVLADASSVIAASFLFSPLFDRSKVSSSSSSSFGGGGGDEISHDLSSVSIFVFSIVMESFFSLKKGADGGFSIVKRHDEL